MKKAAKQKPTALHRTLRDAKDGEVTKTRVKPSGAIVTNTDPCTCGHAPEEHGRDPEYPGSTSCTECDCIAYEADTEAST